MFRAHGLGRLARQLALCVQQSVTSATTLDHVTDSVLGPLRRKAFATVAISVIGAAIGGAIPLYITNAVVLVPIEVSNCA